MRKFVLSSLLIFVALPFAFAQTPTLGTYPATAVATAGGNTIVTPSIAPTNAASISAYTSANFKGLLHVNPATGLVTVTNAYPAGNFSITIKAYNGSLSTTTTFLLTVNSNGCSKGHFNGTGSISSPNFPETLNVGDFNGDGKQDLVIPNGVNGVFVRLGDGTGGFSVSTNVMIGGTPKSIAIGDFNGDGKQDFMTAPGGVSNTVAVRLGNGSGGFTGFSNIPVGQQPISVASGDFNSDGKSDFLTANYTDNNISVRLGDGTGGFTGTLNIPVGNGPRTIVTGDFNNDGKIDFAVTNYFNGNISVKLGDGTGNFTGTTLVTAGPNPFGLAVGDFNNDNKPDLVAANFNSNSFSIRLGDGAGGFTGTQDLNGVNGTQNVSIGDFNSDGNLDLASTNFNIGTISIFLGNGAGGFASPSTTPVGAGPYSVTIGDFNNDGNQDFATANYLDNTASVRLGTVSEINVQGNNNTIPDGNTSISATDFTNLGTIVTGGNITRTYTIQNTGADSLTVSSIGFTGTDASSFMVNGISLPAKIPPASSATLNVTFTPGSTGSKSATISILNDDCNESNYDFVIQGNAVQPPILGNYPATTIATTGGNTTIVPSSAPTTVTTLTAFTSANFKGLLHVDPATGVITVTNAYPAGTYTVMVGVASASTSFLLTVNNPICSQGAVGARIPLLIGVRPRMVAVGDFNNDGKQDIATPNSSANSVSIGLGNGSGGFISSTSVTVGTNPQYIVTGDFNGDGKQDLAVANYSSNNISICSGNGAGGFAVIATVAAGTNPTAIVVADFNNDKKQDLAIINSGTNTVSIRIGNGAGDFINNPDIALSGSAKGITISDFNNDNNSDLAVTIFTSSVVAVWLGNGSGGFSAAANLTATNGPYPIASADFNNDGKQDLAIGNLINNTVVIRLGDGAGNFSGFTTIYPGRNPLCLVAADFNGDSNQDFAVLNEADSTISTFLGNGMGGFTGIANISSGFSSASITIGNFNGDNQLDLISNSSGGNYVWFGVVNEINVLGNNTNITDGDNTPDSLDFTGFGDVANRLIRSFIIQNTGTGNLGINSISISGADASQFTVSSPKLPATIPAGTSMTFNVDFVPLSAGVKNAVLTISNNDCDEAIYDFALQGNGVSITPTLGAYPATTIRAGADTLVIPTVVPTNAVIVSAYTTTNFKGLLHADPVTGAITVTNAHPAGIYPVTVKVSGVASATTTFNLLVNTSGCSLARFAPTTSVAAGTNPESVAIGDFNNDGKQDMAITNRGSNSISVRLGNGAGGFTGTTEVPVGNSPYAIIIGDFNGDGKQDLAAGNFSDNSISIRLGNGMGSFTGNTTVPIGTGTYTSASLAIGDFNNDGKLDLAATNYGLGAVSIRMGDGAGGFSGNAEIAVGNNPTGIAVGDFNGDGNQDFITANYYSNTLSVRLGNGAGGFTGTTITGLNTPVGLAIGDFNNDGKQDIAVTTYPDYVSIFMGNGTGGFTANGTVFTSQSPWSIAIGDFNNDGKQDFVTGNTGGNSISIRLGNGNGGFSVPFTNIALPGSGQPKIAVGDFNGDGLYDLVATTNNLGGSGYVLMGITNAINIKGNNNSITDGSNIPDTVNHTSFGSVATGSNLTRTFTIENTGTDSIRINSITITGPDSLLFSRSGISLPTTILAGASKTFTLTFSPVEGGIKNARVNVGSNNCSTAVYDFAVNGRAVCTTLSANNIWLGTTADWNIPGNWSLGFVPNGCGVAVVNAGVPFMPQISTNATCYSLTLNNGATVTVTGTGQLTITGP